MKKAIPGPTSDKSASNIKTPSVSSSGTSTFQHVAIPFRPFPSNPLSKKPADKADNPKAAGESEKKNTGTEEVPRNHHRHIGDGSQTSETTERGWVSATLTADESTEKDFDLLSLPSQLALPRHAFGFSQPSQDYPGWIPFNESTISIAVDISFSTKERVLREELTVISVLGHQLSPDANEKMKILPWNHSAHLIMSPEETFLLTSEGNTDPASIFSSSSFVEALRGSSLWFLLTDGMIYIKNTIRFAKGIAEHRLHGTPCVVVVFGYTSSTPMELNVSVGIAVFAATPHCLFLFHDLATGRVYVLQSKGCFTRIISPSSVTPMIDASTAWDDLPRICYGQLAQLHIPRPHEDLGKDDLVLSGGQVIKMEDVYLNRLEIQSTSEIFDNDADMKSVLLTGATRGRSKDVEAWVSSQSFPQEDLLVIPRPDVDGKALELTRRLLKLMRGINVMDERKNLENELKKAHLRNWKSFQLTVIRYRRNGSRQSGIVKDSKRRLDETRSGSFSSPCVLGSVYSSRGEDAATSSSKRLRTERKSPGYPIIKMEEEQPGSSEPTWVSPPPRELSFTGQDAASGLLYTTSYRRLPNASHNVEFAGTCGFCASWARPLALLLKTPGRNTSTETLPAPGDRAKYDHPAFPIKTLYPALDIISRFMCCDPCSCFLRQVGEGPSANDEIVGAILLTNYAENRSQWIAALDEALSHRFAKESIEHVFLAILRQSIPNTLSRYTHHLTIKKALGWAVCQIEEHIACSEKNSPGT